MSEPVKTRKLLLDEIQLRGAMVLSAQIVSTDEFLLTAKPVLRTSTKSECGITFNADLKMVRARFKFDIVGVDGDKPVGVTAKFDLAFDFILEKIADFLSKGPNDEELIDAEATAILLSIAYGTARGIILDRTMGTMLNGVLIPIVDPAVFLNQTALPAQ